MMQQTKMKKQKKNQATLKRRQRQQPKRMNILKKSKHLRRWFLRNPWLRPLIVFNYAAITLQKAFRGFLVRRKTFIKVVGKINTKTRRTQSQLDKYLNFVESCKSKRVKRKPAWLAGGYSAWCAVRIQATWRMRSHMLRFQRGRRLVNQVAAIVVQTAWRNYYLSKYGAKKRQLNAVTAALMIQSLWRRFCNRRVFRYYRDLVVVKLRGAPAELLRAIVPNEVDLMDRAAGVHVRFRLGGPVFPPRIYFKVYTHKPVCDVNAFAPRDYSSERQLEPLQLHNKFASLDLASKRMDVATIRVGKRYFDSVLATSVGAVDNWYQRVERNNWRCISSRAAELLGAPPWHRETVYESRPKPFHYSRLRRHQELQLDRKRKKRDWMRKAYLLTHPHEQEQAEAQPPGDAENINRPSNHNNHQHRVHLEVPGVKPPRYERPGVSTLTLPSVHSPASSPRTVRRIATARSDRSDATQYLPLVSSRDRDRDRDRDRAASPGRGDGGRGGAGAEEEGLGLGLGLLENMPSRRLLLLEPMEGAKKPPPQAQAQQLSTIEQIQRGSGCIYSKSKSSHLLLSSSIARDRDRDRGRPFKQEYMNDNYQPADDDAVDLVLWSSALNFDDYAKEWATMGTSLPSDITDEAIYSNLVPRGSFDREYYGTIKP